MYPASCREQTNMITYMLRLKRRFYRALEAGDEQMCDRITDTVIELEDYIESQGPADDHTSGRTEKAYNELVDYVFSFRQEGD